MSTQGSTVNGDSLLVQRASQIISLILENLPKTFALPTYKDNFNEKTKQFANEVCRNFQKIYVF